jgi:hypothetical protein
MVKARDILFKIAFIFSIIAIVCYAIAFVVFGIIGIIGFVGGIISMTNSNAAAFGAIMDSEFTSGIYFDSSSSGEEPEALFASAILMLVFACVFFVELVLSIVNTVVIKKASTKHTKNLYIASIVFGVITGNEIGLVAAIFGLILLNKENSKPVEATITKDNVVEEKNDEEKPNDTEESK